MSHGILNILKYHDEHSFKVSTLSNSRENSREKGTIGRAFSTLFSPILERIGCCVATNGKWIMDN